jgi:Domain of unknown function (DUF4386)
MIHESELKTKDSEWKCLFTAGGVAALIAGLLFRRNIAAEVSLFSAQQPPASILEVFTLLQNNRLLGLMYLNLFDLVNYVLLGVVYLALYVALKGVNRSCMALAAILGFMGITAYLTSNTALSLLSLSDQYASAASEAQRAALLAAGQALLANIRFSGPGAYPGAAGYLSLLLIALAGLITSIVMLRSAEFSRATAAVGILASAFDLAYCVAFLFLPAVGGERLALIFIPAAGLFWMLWQVLVGLRLIRLDRPVKP